MGFFHVRYGLTVNPKFQLSLPLDHSISRYTTDKRQAGQAPTEAKQSKGGYLINLPRDGFTENGNQSGHKKHISSFHTACGFL